MLIRMGILFLCETGHYDLVKMGTIFLYENKHYNFVCGNSQTIFNVGTDYIYICFMCVIETLCSANGSNEMEPFATVSY